MYVPLSVVALVVVAGAACVVAIAVLGARAIGADEVARWADDADRRVYRVRIELLQMRVALRAHDCTGAACDFAARAANRLHDIASDLEG